MLVPGLVDDIRRENESFFNNKRVWVTGHKGMLGSALVRILSGTKAKILVATRQDLDLRNQNDVDQWVEDNQPELIFHVGAMVGGIFANATMPADFLYSNLMIQSHVIDAAKRTGVEKLIFVASNCTYPTNAAQPIAEEALLTGPLESNIHSYAVGKIAGIEMCRAYRKQYGCNFISVIPPNLYGPGDNYHPQHGHVVAGILRRAFEAKESNNDELIVWGDGTPRREILHVDDLASAMIFLMAQKEIPHELYNIGCGHDLSIGELAQLISEVVGFKGKIKYDTTKPNGTMRKLLDCSRINSLGWCASVNEKTGLNNAFEDFMLLLQQENKGHRY